MSDLQDLWNNDREQLRQVRTQLATVTAELATLQDVRADLADMDAKYLAERAAHAETRKALEGAQHDRENALRQCHNMAERFDREMAAALESTRAALARSEARVKAADDLLHRCLSGPGEVHGPIRAEINTHLDGSNG